MLKAISLRTTKCIVTGETATVWSGHFRAKVYGTVRDDGRIEKHEVAVLAGFANSDVCMSADWSDKNGCFGEWEEKHGIAID
jgi:hypothetical protein